MSQSKTEQKSNNFLKYIDKWLLIAIFSGAILVVYNPMSAIANSYSTDVAAAAAGLYGILRAANSVMSVIHDVDVEASALVAGVTTSPGQALEPVIDTIDRTSDLLFGLMIVAGVLAFLAIPLGTVGGAAMVLGAGFLLLLPIVRSSEILQAINAEAIARNAVKIGLFCAVILPAAFSLSGWLGDRLTDRAYSEASTVFESIGATSESVQTTLDEELNAVEIDQLEDPSSSSEETDEQSGGFLDTARRSLSSVYDGTSQAVGDAVSSTRDFAISIPGIIANNTLAISEWVSLGLDLFEATVSIAVAYILKLIVLPIMLIAAIFYLLRTNAQASLAPDGSQSRLAVSKSEGASDDA